MQGEVVPVSLVSLVFAQGPAQRRGSVTQLSEPLALEMEARKGRRDASC